MGNLDKFAGWALCVVSVLMLAGLGKLELLIVLVPLSALLTFFITGFNSRKDNSAGNGKKGIA
jgi:hypothetical protein